MMNKTFRSLSAVSLLFTAQAQFAANPFQEHPQALSFAFATELAEIRLDALAALEDLEGAFLEEVEEGLEEDLRRFAGSLEAQDPELAERLEAALADVLAAAEAGSGLEEALNEARDVLRQAQRLLVPDDLRESPPFVAALMSQLLLDEGGVAEGYEEAVEGEVWEYPVGFAALERVKELWGELVSLASETQRFEIEDMLGAFDALYQAPLPPEGIENSDPEEGEAAAHRIVGFLEELSDAALYPERNLGELISLTSNLAQTGCSAYQDGQAALGLESMVIAGAYYEEDLGDTLNLFTPETHAEIANLFEELSAEGVTAEAAAAPCAALLEQLEQARSLLGV